MRYDALGNLQKSQLGGSAPPAMRKGPIQGRIAQKKKEDFVELINELRQQVQAYLCLARRLFAYGVRFGCLRSVR
ncbi:MAG: hypothetical protein ACREEM_34410 [Blastocatellia bacterium]